MTVSQSCTATNFVVAGTTNQVVFGATNTPPQITSAPARWISVKVAGDNASYRLPLYQ